jgi:hypothetical protein
MELKKVQQFWSGFPETSMEERPILSSDLEKIVVANPLSAIFYLKNKLLVRIWIAALLWLANAWQLSVQWKADGNDLYQYTALCILLSWFIYFHVRLLWYADYPTLLSLTLVPFLHKLETVLDKYIASFKILSVIAAFYLLDLFQQILRRLNLDIYRSVSQNGFYKWLIIIFLSVSFYIFLLHTIIPKYRKRQTAVSRYKFGITARSQKK